VEHDIQRALRIITSLRSKHTQRQYKAILRELEEWAISNRIDDIDVETAFEYADYLSQKQGERPRNGGSDKTTRATVQRKLVIIRAAWKALKVEPNPWFEPLRHIRGAKTGTKRPTIALDAQDVLQLINSPHPGNREGIRDRALLACLFGGGMRCSEPLGLRLRNLHLDKSAPEVTLENTKGGGQQHQVLPSWAAQRVNQLARWRLEQDHAEPDEFLFVRWTKSGPHPWLYKSAFTHFKEICTAAGIKEKIATHCGRATAATRLLEKGFDYRQVAEFLRHSTMNMVGTYDKRAFGGESSAALHVDYNEVKPAKAVLKSIK